MDSWANQDEQTVAAFCHNTVDRRRLRQKLELLTDDLAAQSAPTEEDLRANIAVHPEKFRVARRYSFHQVDLNPQRQETDLQASLDSVLNALSRDGTDAEIAALGGPSLLEPRFENLLQSEVETQIGPTFAAALGRLTPGQWEGPIRSGYGLHFVLLSKRVEGRPADLAEVGDVVHREWANDRRLKALESFYEAALKRYNVRTETVAPATKEARPWSDCCRPLYESPSLVEWA